MRRLALACLLCLITPPGSVAFDYEVHYTLNYYLALHAGYTEEQAYRLASAAQAIDEDPDTGPMRAQTMDAIFGSEADLSRISQEFRHLGPRSLDRFREHAIGMIEGKGSAVSAFVAENAGAVLAGLGSDRPDTGYWESWVGLLLGYSPRSSPDDPAPNLGRAGIGVVVAAQTSALLTLKWWDSTKEFLFGGTEDHWRGHSAPAIRQVWSKFHAFYDSSEVVWQSAKKLDLLATDAGLSPEDRGLLQTLHAYSPVVHEYFGRDWRNDLSPFRVNPTPAGLRAREEAYSDLWLNVGVKDKNFGAALHFLQDSFSHQGFDTIRGHASVGHLPDFLSYDREVSLRMVAATLHSMCWFREIQALSPSVKAPVCNHVDKHLTFDDSQAVQSYHQADLMPSSPPWDRIVEVVDRLILANPNESGLIGNFDPELEKLARLTRPLNELFWKGAPNLQVSSDLVGRAILEDRKLGRLPATPAHSIAGLRSDTPYSVPQGNSWSEAFAEAARMFYPSADSELPSEFEPMKKSRRIPSSVSLRLTAFTAGLKWPAQPYPFDHVEFGFGPDGRTVSQNFALEPLKFVWDKESKYEVWLEGLGGPWNSSQKSRAEIRLRYKILGTGRVDIPAVEACWDSAGQASFPDASRGWQRTGEASAWGSSHVGYVIGRDSPFERQRHGTGPSQLRFFAGSKAIARMASPLLLLDRSEDRQITCEVHVHGLEKVRIEGIKVPKIPVATAQLLGWDWSRPAPRLP